MCEETGKEGRWQRKIANLKQGIHYIYDTKVFSDIGFKVGKKHFRAHKLILAARSSEFARILLDPYAVDEVIVDVEDDSGTGPVTETGFEILLLYMYKDTLGTENKKSIVEAYLAANRYKQKALMDKCREKMDSWIIIEDEVCNLLNVGLNIPLLREKCLHFIKENADKVISVSAFFSLSFKSLNSILDNRVLENVPVAQRIKKIIEWGANHHSQPVDYSLVREEFLDYKPPLLGKLEFQTLNLPEFSGIVTSYKGLLNPFEVVSFMEYFSKKDASVLPEWCIAV